jgi:hypothetical protein
LNEEPPVFKLIDEFSAKAPIRTGNDFLVHRIVASQYAYFAQKPFLEARRLGFPSLGGP